MGKRGPSKKPYEIKESEGFPGGKDKAQKPAIDPKKETEIPDPPMPFGGNEEVAGEIWNRVSAELIKLGVLTKVDHFALYRYCDAFARWLECKVFLDLHGQTMNFYHQQTDEQIAAKEEPKIKYAQQRPEVAMYHKYAGILSKLEGEFGLTPSARSSIVVEGGSIQQGIMSKFLFGPRGKEHVSG